VLYRVRDVDRVTVDSRGVEGFVQDAPRRADERLAGDVLFVARLLADEDDLGGPAALAETVCVALFHRSQAWQCAAASRHAPRLFVSGSSG